MSAYVVDKNHIVYLVQAAVSRRLAQYDGGGIGWNYAKEGEDAKHLRGTSEASELVAVGQMLWNENVKSVMARYQDTTSDNLPGRIDDGEEGYKLTESDFNGVMAVIDPVQVLKACHCYEYQSCEHKEWEKSEAFDFITCLKTKAEKSLVGYDKAEWGAPKKPIARDYAKEVREEMRAKSRPALHLVMA